MTAWPLSGVVLAMAAGRVVVGMRRCGYSLGRRSRWRSIWRGVGGGVTWASQVLCC